MRAARGHIFLLPCTPPRRFLALPDGTNRGAPLPSPARARARLPSPAPNPPDKRPPAQSEPSKQSASAAGSSSNLLLRRMDTTAAVLAGLHDAQKELPPCPVQRRRSDPSAHENRRQGRQGAGGPESAPARHARRPSSCPPTRQTRRVAKAVREGRGSGKVGAGHK